MKNIIVKSYAKINIALNVLGKRSDGYHELDMVMVPIQLHDSLLIGELFNKTVNFVTMDDYSLDIGKMNISTRALDIFTEDAKFNNKFRVLIHKVIPIQGGFGGGSSNAAATVRGVNQYLKLGYTDEQIAKLLKPIGADIPFFAHNKPMRCRGIGDEMNEIKVKNNYGVLIVKPHIGCSTKEVYKTYDTVPGEHGDVDAVVKALEEGDDETLGKVMFNSLQNAAISLVPEIKVLIDILRAEGLTMVQMTGSGSGVFALSQDLRKLKKVASKLENDYQVEVTKILRV